MRLVSALVGGCLVLTGVAACSDTEADPEPEDTPVVDTSIDVDGDAAGGGDEGEPAGEGDDSEEYEHPVPGPDFDDDGQAGAEAAAVYFVELFSYIHATGDFEAWDELTTDDCSFCTGVRAEVEAIYGTGGTVVTGPPAIHETRAQLDHDVDGAYVVEVSFHEAEMNIFDAGGSLSDEFADADVITWVRVANSDGWSVLGAEGEAVAE